MERHDYTFREGERIRFRSDAPVRDEGEFIVASVETVPPESVDYDPITQEGGVGHHQWIVMVGREGVVSGHLLEPVK